jgi:AraC-like DNA-binding protein
MELEEWYLSLSICACLGKSNDSPKEGGTVSGYYGQVGVQIRVGCSLSMVNNGHSMTANRHPAGILRLDYRPPGSNPLDLEIFSVSDLRRRVGKGFFQATHRYGFHMLLCVARGECTHLIDFEPVACKPGSLLAIQPAQAHRFGSDQRWDGWIILFRPEFLPPSNTTAPYSELRLASELESLPQSLWLQENELRVVTGTVGQMQKDSRIAAPSEQVHALLRHQMYTLLLRLAILHNRQQAPGNANCIALRRFKTFQRLVEKRFSRWHTVAEYASRLGCSEKSLTRAAMEGAGVKAKNFITSRINLEAKRLLAHTVLPIAVIGEQLGFQDPTNFVKFFRREIGCTPGQFRRRQVIGTK